MLHALSAAAPGAEHPGEQREVVAPGRTAAWCRVVVGHLAIGGGVRTAAGPEQWTGRPKVLKVLATHAQPQQHGRDALLTGELGAPLDRAPHPTHHHVHYVAPVRATAGVVPSKRPDPAAVIGSQVRQYRVGRGWTLDQLADRSGVSRRMLVNIEQGAANPASRRCCGSATRWVSASRRWSRPTGRRRYASPAPATPPCCGGGPRAGWQCWSPAASLRTSWSCGTGR